MLGPRTENYSSEFEALPESQEVYVEHGGRLARDKEYDIDELVTIVRAANIKWFAAVEKNTHARKDEIDRVDAFGEAEIALQAVDTAWRRLPEQVRKERKQGKRQS